MKDFVKMLGFFLQLLIFTLVLTACFAGLYGLAHFQDPVYRKNKSLLKEEAVQWGLKMTGFSFLAFIGVIIISVTFNQEVIDFLGMHPEGVALTTLGIAGTLLIGLVSSFFTLLDI